MKRLEPIPVERPWGGDILKKLFGWVGSPDRIGEALVHDGARAPSLILKWIQAEECLSIQNHPSRPGFSKREVWYFVSPPRDGRVITGISCPMTTPDPRPYLEYTSIEQGDLMEVPAGRLHALTPGSLVLEIQEPLDVTYRIYDWGRGRELHLREAQEALTSKPIIRHARVKGIGLRRLIACSEFTIEDLAGPHEVRADSIGILTLVTGARFGESWMLDPGDSFTMHEGEEAIWAAT